MIIVYQNIMVNPQLFVYWQLTGNGTPGAAFPTIGFAVILVASHM
jgi:hypothetical protein